MSIVTCFQNEVHLREKYNDTIPVSPCTTRYIKPAPECTIWESLGVRYRGFLPIYTLHGQHMLWTRLEGLLHGVAPRQPVLAWSPIFAGCMGCLGQQHVATACSSQQSQSASRHVTGSLVAVIMHGIV